VTRTVAFLAAAVAITGLAACSDADVASRNLSQAADNFEVPRRVVLYNGITDAYIQEVKGFCSRGNADTGNEVTITCKTPTGFVKHMWILGDNQLVFVEQLQDVKVGTDFYTVNFKPSVIIPDFKVR
jgi:hypothetical protein